MTSPVEQESGFPHHRLRCILAEHYGTDPKNIQGYVLGEHGNDAFVAWSTVNCASLGLDYLDAYFERCLSSSSALAAVEQFGESTKWRSSQYSKQGLDSAIRFFVSCSHLSRASK